MNKPNYLLNLLSHSKVYYIYIKLFTTAWIINITINIFLSFNTLVKLGHQKYKW